MLKDKLEEILLTVQRLELKSQLPVTWLSVTDLAQYMKSSPSTIRRLISTGSIPFRRVGENGKIIFNRKQIDFWLLSGEKYPGKRIKDTFKDLL